MAKDLVLCISGNDGMVASAFIDSSFGVLPDGNIQEQLLLSARVQSTVNLVSRSWLLKAPRKQSCQTKCTML